MHNAHGTHVYMHDTHPIGGLDLNLLWALDALLATSSVTQAARRLGLTQSATSRALGRLRLALRDELLVRMGRGMALTPHAEALRPHVQRLLGEARYVLSERARFSPGDSSRVFRVAAADFFATVAVPAWLRHVQHTAPGVRLEVITVAHPEAELESGTLDLVVSPVNTLVGAGWMRMRVLDEHFVVLCRTDHPSLANPWNLEAYAAQRHLLVAPGGRPGSEVDRLLAAEGLSRQVAVLVQGFGAAAPIIAASDLVVTLPSRLAALEADRWGLVTRPCPLPGFGFSLDAFWHARFSADPAHRWLRETVQALRPF